MKVQLNVDLKDKNGAWNLFLEKKLKMDFLPNSNEEIEDNGLFFKVKSRKFYLEGYVDIMLELELEIVDDLTKKDVLNRMHDSGWTYRGDTHFDIRDMVK